MLFTAKNQWGEEIILHPAQSAGRWILLPGQLMRLARHMNRPFARKPADRFERLPGNVMPRYRGGELIGADILF